MAVDGNALTRRGADGEYRRCGTPSGHIWRLHHRRRRRELPREQSVAEFLGGRLYVFSGGANVAYTDGYAYDPKTRAWTEIKGLNVDGTPVSLLGARSVRLNVDEMLVVGGFNHEIYNWAVSNLSTLQGEEKYAEPRRRVVPLTEHLS